MITPYKLTKYCMTMKKKGRGRDRSKKNNRKHSRNTDPAPQTREYEEHSEQSPETSYSFGWNSPGVVEGRASNGEIAKAGGEPATGSSPVETMSDRREHQLQVGLHQLASYSKNSSVLSTLAPIFESNLNIIRDGTDVVNKNTQMAPSRVGPAQSSTACGGVYEANSRENTRDETREGPPSDTIGAGAASSFDLLWAKRFHELEEVENSRKIELEKEMHDARCKLEIEMNRAKIEREVMEKRREIERQQLELRKLEESAYGQSPEHADTFISSFNTPDRVGYRTWEPNDPGVRTIPVSSESRDSASQLQHLLERQQNTMDEVVRGLRMPQREYITFYGEPRDFPLFMRNFEVNVESKEKSDADRLNYLIQYCKGKARQAIEHCIIMPPNEGYQRAKEILRRSFGRNHIVTQAFLDKVITGPPIKAHEADKLSQLARDMETCLMGSTQLGNEAHINSIDTLGKIVGRLPIHLRSKWAEKASQLYDKHVTSNFSHLMDFIQDRAAVANTYFGQIISGKPEANGRGKLTTPHQESHCNGDSY